MEQNFQFSAKKYYSLLLWLLMQAYMKCSAAWVSGEIVLIASEELCKDVSMLLRFIDQTRVTKNKYSSVVFLQQLTNLDSEIGL